MPKMNPCSQDCPRRALGCRAECPEWAEAQALRAQAWEAKRKDTLVLGYLKQSAARKKRRARR